MIRPHFASAIAVAAVIAAAPAFAATSSKSVPAADQTSKPLCSSFKNRNAGKLADKATGQAQEHSASPVHEDCIPDSSASSATATPSSPSSATYGGLPDTSSNAQSSMPSTASSSSSSIYDDHGTTTPKMNGDTGASKR